LGLLDVFRRKREEAQVPPAQIVQRAQAKEGLTWKPRKAPIKYEGTYFKLVEGLDDIKYVLEHSIRRQYDTRVTGQDLRIHVLLVGPPGVSKSLLLLEAEKEIPEDRRVFVLGSQVSKAGLRDRLLSNPNIDFVFIDELDKMEKENYDVLLSLMETGRIAVLKHGIQKDEKVMATVIATANYLEKIPVELLDRFLLLYLDSYDSQDFVKVATRILVERGKLGREQAEEIARLCWEQGYRSIRDVVRVANFAQGDISKADMILSIMAARAPPIEDEEKKEPTRKLKEELEVDSEYQTTVVSSLTIKVREEDDVEEKLKVERAGIKEVIKLERKRAGGDKEKIKKIKDVSAKFKGYDVESFDRVIEVKSFRNSGRVEFTPHEWRTALRMRKTYWLYVVENALTEPKITCIQDPAERFKNKVKIVRIVDYRYVVEDWKT
jgi:MoxR-like ATPase